MKNSAQRNNSNSYVFIGIIALTLSIFIGLLISSRALAFPNTIQPQTRSRLCGKLLFLTDTKTGAKLIGLKSCDGSELFIFKQHPKELYNYYQFTDATITSGSATSTQMGKISKYITGWQGYIEIHSCAECGSNPTPFPIPPPAPTQPPIPISTATSTNTAYENVVVCSTYVVDVLKNALPVNDASQIITIVNILLKCQFECRSKSTSYLQWYQCYKGCADWKQFEWVAKILIKTHPIGKIIMILFDILNPRGLQACGDLGPVISDLVTSLSKNGLPINLFGIHSSATLLIIDEQGRRTGFLEDGSIIQEIPDTLAVISGESKYILQPGELQTRIRIDAYDHELISMSAIRNTDTTIQDMIFSNIEVDNGMFAVLDTSGSAPLLILNNSGEEKVIFPDYFVETIKNPSPIFTETPTPIQPPSFQPSPSPMPPTPFQPSSPSIPCLGGLLILFIPLAKFRSK
jgi:hypothetical protein